MHKTGILNCREGFLYGYFYFKRPFIFYLCCLSYFFINKTYNAKGSLVMDLV